MGWVLSKLRCTRAPRQCFRVTMLGPIGPLERMAGGTVRASPARAGAPPPPGDRAGAPPAPVISPAPFRARPAPDLPPQSSRWVSASTQTATAMSIATSASGCSTSIAYVSRTRNHLREMRASRSPSYSMSYSLSRMLPRTSSSSPAASSARKRSRSSVKPLLADGHQHLPVALDGHRVPQAHQLLADDGDHLPPGSWSSKVSRTRSTLPSTRRRARPCSSSIQ